MLNQCGQLFHCIQITLSLAGQFSENRFILLRRFTDNVRQGLSSIAHIGNGAAQVLRNIGQAAVERRKGAIKYIIQILIQQLAAFSMPAVAD